ncbi:MAG: cobalt ECF transporter T component CbiQ [Leptolyngbya sp. Prado105]|jgi:cobalt/nickel transport system permease protein|nr:cobalt ECF transporter T component CbiQ [Leptolyngbya sp. Prado105]
MHLWLDTLSHHNRLRQLPPSHKLLFAAIALLMALISTPIVQLAIALWLSIWIVIYARIPCQIYFRLLSLVIGFWLMSVPALLIGLSERSQTDAILGGSIGSVYFYLSHQGISQAALIFTRTIATVSCLYFVLFTTPFSEILQVLRQIRCPEILTELLLLMYRFIFILLSTASDLWIAQHSRNGYRSTRRWFYSLSLLVSQLFRKTMENYQQFVLSTAARGFNGAFRVYSPQQYRASRRYTIEASLGCLILILIRLCR